MIPQSVHKRIDRMQGTLLGVALGDAVGAPFDGWSHGTIREHVGRVNGPSARREEDYLLFRVRRGERPKKVAKAAGMVHPPGLYNHFGQQALIAAELIVTDGELTPEAFARACVRFLHPSRRGKFGLHRKPSPAFRTSITRFAKGASLDEMPEEPALVEAAVRVLPGALAFDDDFEARVRRAFALASITDCGAEGLMPAVATALLGHRLVACEPPADPLAALDGLCDDLAQAERIVGETGSPDIPTDPENIPLTRHALRALIPWVGAAGDMADDRIALEALAREVNKLGPSVRHVSNGYAPVMFAAAAYLCLTEKKGPGETILRAVNQGGKTSALGALTGGLAGALWGRETLPSDWIETLWNNKAASQLGELALRPDIRDRWPGNLYEIEVDLNRRSREVRQGVRDKILAEGKT